MGTSPEFNFSLPELEEAGLLLRTDTAYTVNAASTGAEDWTGQDLLSYIGSSKGQDASPPDGQHSSRGEGEAEPLQHAGQRARSGEAFDLIPDKRHANREYQKRFRERQKAKTQAVAEQLADTTEELAKLKVQRQELEVKLQQTQAQLQAKSTIMASIVPSGEKPSPAQSSFDTRPLNITLPGRESQLTFQEAQSMPAQLYCSLWECYRCEIQRQLNEVQPDTGVCADSRLCQLFREALHFKSFSSAFMLGGPNTRASMEPSPEEASDLLQRVKGVVDVLELSEGQVEDLMFLRRIYFLRRHELKTQLAALHLRTQEYDAEPIFAPSRVANVARQLHRNAVEDLQTMLRFSWTMYLGTLTIQQAAQLLTSFGAQYAIREPFLNYVAQKHGYPTQHELITGAPFGLTHYDWTRAWHFSESTNPWLPIKTGYVPIPIAQPTPCPERALY